MCSLNSENRLRNDGANGSTVEKERERERGGFEIELFEAERSGEGETGVLAKLLLGTYIFVKINHLVTLLIVIFLKN